MPWHDRKLTLHCTREKTCHAECAYVRMQVVQDYNANDDVHGILVQLPLPKHINEQCILDAISLEKDVDGFHPFNIGSLLMRGRQPLYTSCTPKVGRHSSALVYSAVMRVFSQHSGKIF